ncbi:sucrose-specific PTS transporter subunit IIBC [Iodobacter ciconiae]|uniref:PTS sucrose transporter subunit IIBC n=1 Tax=Iodobacter ciconiae TaxID=2496266 RepID=A0A3S8ZPK2_9NEIS|nr:sucrose-specific PTS transporter subunit IIBC [Iodobacter ciconiae]AZN35400.1 PTS sucrose transporter subunit IIBC [Iodobacter ciconiae]
MNYQQIATDILPLIGGTDNIVSIAHCATRLRLVLKDQQLVNKPALEALDSVKGCFTNGGQFQIVLGQGVVNHVCEALIANTGLNEASTQESKTLAAARLGPAQRLAQMLSNIFVPIIPVIVACGLLMGVIGTARTLGLAADTPWLQILDMFSNTAFVFLPILIAISAAREFNTNPFLAAALGGIMIHPALQNAWTVGGGIHEYWTLFGLHIAKVGYQGTVLPVLLAVWMQSHIERQLRRVVPNSLDLILTPFLTLMLSALAALLLIGPFGRMLGDGISLGLMMVYQHGGVLAGMLFGGAYSLVVITGVHHSFHAIEAGLLSNPAIGKNFLLPIWAMANVAQGGAALAVFFRTSDAKVKQIALPAALSCLLGITEAAIFGVNLRFVRPFVAAAIGGALGGAWIVFNQVFMTAIGVTGLPGIALVPAAGMLNYIAGLMIAFGSAFVASWLFGLKQQEAKA